MAKDMGDAVRDALGQAVRQAVKNMGDASPKKAGGGRFSGPKGIAAGAGLAAAAPLAKKGLDTIRNGGLGALTPSPGKLATNVASKAGDKVGSNLKDVVSSKVDEAGGAGGLVKGAASGLLPGIGGDDGDGNGQGGVPGVGKGRRMPVQQAVDVAVPIETAYNQFTQFEGWPEFMHRVTRVTQEDDCTLSFATKIWGKTKEFEARIETQRPDERIKWRVAQGITHSGVVTFHELAPSLTRIEVTLDVDPGSLIEKAARGMRHVKRAVRADLARFKAFIEMQELQTGAWRGVIEDGELVEPHDDSYDDEPESSEDEGQDRDEDRSQDENEDEELPRDRAGRFQRGAGAKSDREIAAAAAGSGSSSRSTGGASRSKGSSSRSGSERSSGSSNGSGSSKSSSRSSSKSSGKRQSTRTPGETNGKGRSSSKRSSGTSSSRRRSSSRS